MVATVPVLSGHGTVLHVRMSLPLVADLVAEYPEKYMLLEDTPPADSLGASSAGNKPAACGFTRSAKKTRAPSLRAMVRLAVRSQSAKEFGAKLKQRWDAKAARRPRYRPPAPGRCQTR
jgi:hypothetical protein